MLDDNAVADAAQRLLAAESDRRPIRQLSLQYPEMTIEDAHRVQRALTAAKLAEGRTVKARKIGLTSRASSWLAPSPGRSSSARATRCTRTSAILEP